MPTRNDKFKLLKPLIYLDNLFEDNQFYVKLLYMQLCI